MAATHAHDDRPRGLGAADDRRAGDRAGIALVPARLLGDTVKSLSDAPVDVRDRPVARRGSAARPTRARCGCSRPRTSRAAGARRHRRSRPRPARSPRPCRAGGRGRPAATRPDRSSPGCCVEVSREGVRAGRDRLVPAGGPRPGRHAPTARRRRSCPSARCPRPGAAAVGRREGHGRDLRRRGAGVVQRRRADAHVAADRGRVPELPPAPAGHAREPTDGLAPAAARTPCAASGCSLATPRRCGWSSTRSA